MCIRDRDKSTENYSFNPSIVLHYAMSDNSYLRWKGNIYKDVYKRQVPANVNKKVVSKYINS